MSSPHPASPTSPPAAEDGEELSFNPNSLFGAAPAEPAPAASAKVAEVTSCLPSPRKDQPDAPPTLAVDDSDVVMAGVIVEEEAEDELVMNGLLGGGGVSRAQEKPSSPPPAGDLNASRQAVESNGRTDATSSRVRSPPPMDEAEAEDDGFTMNGILGGGDQLDLPSVSSSSGRPPPPRTSAAANLTGLHLRDGLTTSSNFATTSTDHAIASLSDLLPPRQGTSTTSYASHSRYLPVIKATTFSGRDITIKRKPRKAIDTEAIANVTNLPRDAQGTLSLLETPIHRLKDEIEQDERAAPRLLKLAESARTARLADVKGKGKGPETSMWVDRYRPKKFADLLGDEKVNRETMTWLKEWDQCVFKRRAPKTKKRTWGETAGEEEFENPDPLGRPREKVLLLSGPPGLGKTTLAQIVANQAGYEVLEINASDDRNAATVTSRIQNALDSGSKFASKKPTLIVIDEIDGATGGGDQSFIKSLIKLIQDVPARKQKGGVKMKEPKMLMRPIICICNDLYSSAVRPLRPFARIVRFNKPPVAVLVKRLKFICEIEGLKADSRSLNTLSEVTGCDIRSCLNSLQFIKSKSSILDDAMVKQATVGIKDSGTSLQRVWDSLFVPLSVKKRKAGLGVEEGKFLNRLVDVVSSCGEYDRLMQGCFEHYPNLKWQDSDFARANKMHDWVHFHDRVTNEVNSNQTYELMAYLPYSMIPWHTEFALHANSSRPTDFPKQDYESHLRRTTNLEIATSLTQSLPPTIRSLFNATTLLTEFAPLLMRVLSPTLKPVNAQVIKPGERQTLNRLVEVMVLHNLRFYQEKNEDGQLSFRLDPPIDVFVSYEGKRAGDIAVSRYAVRNLVSQEIEAEILRRHQAAYPEKSEHAMFKNNKKPAGEIDIADKAATDFFGRTIALKPVEEGVEEAPPEKRFRVFYKYHDGSSSAVRKMVKMGSLF